MTIDFINALRAQLCSHNEGDATTFLVLLHQDAEITSKSPSLSGLLSDICSAEVSISPLPSGYSKDVHGTLVVREFPCSPPIPPVVKTHYKLLDSAIKVFSVGDVM